MKMCDMCSAAEQAKQGWRDLLVKVKQANAANEGLPLTYSIEYKRLLQWQIEKSLAALDLPYSFDGGRDGGGGEQAAFERASMEEYRKRLFALREKYSITGSET